EENAAHLLALRRARDFFDHARGARVASRSQSVPRLASDSARARRLWHQYRFDFARLDEWQDGAQGKHRRRSVGRSLLTLPIANCRVSIDCFNRQLQIGNRKLIYVSHW